MSEAGGYFKEALLELLAATVAHTEVVRSYRLIDERLSDLSAKSEAAWQIELAEISRKRAEEEAKKKQEKEQVKIESGGLSERAAARDARKKPFTKSLYVSAKMLAEAKERNRFFHDCKTGTVSYVLGRIRPENRNEAEAVLRDIYEEID
jgi:hypothetical protein